MVKSAPKYDYNDIVEFDIKMNDKMQTMRGSVEIIDKYGTFEQNEEPSYDIMVEDYCGSGQAMFFKHIRESCINRKIN